MKSRSALVKQLALEGGFERVGIAPTQLVSGDFHAKWLAEGFAASMDYLNTDRNTDKVMPGATSAIMVAVNYAQPAGTGVRIARYALGRDYHNLIGKRLEKLAARLSQEFPEARFRKCVDTAPIPERELGHLAGLGWFGKNTMLIDSKRGSWFFIGSLLTDLELTPDQPSEGGCGTCTRCIDACPTGAIVPFQDRWAVDSRKCLSYWTIEHRGDIPNAIAEAASDIVFGCDICQEVCPFNEEREGQPLRAAQTTEPDFINHSPLARASREELEAMDFETWDRLSRGSPIRRAGFEGLKRNLRLAKKRNETP